MQQLSPTAKLGMSMRFRVSVDGINLGNWATCTGLSVEFKNTKYNEGANYVLADGHAKWFRGSAVSAGRDNNLSGDCTSYQGFTPAGTRGSPYAASATCADSAMGATFSVN